MVRPFAVSLYVKAVSCESDADAVRSGGEALITLRLSRSDGEPTDAKQSVSVRAIRLTAAGHHTDVDLTATLQRASADEGTTDGVWNATLRPVLSGTYRVLAFVSGLLIEGASRFEVLPGAPDATRSVCTGAGLSRTSVGAPATFRLHARDASGNECSPNPRSVSATFRGRPVRVRSAGDGSLECSYTAAEPGDAELCVATEGSAIPGSPFAIRVEPGLPVASRSTLHANRPDSPAFGTSDENCSLTVAPSGSVFVVARDQSGARLRWSGGSCVWARVVDLEDGNSLASAIDATVLDLHDGTYEVCVRRVAASMSGRCLLEIGMKEESVTRVGSFCVKRAISGSPLRLDVPEWPAQDVHRRNAEVQKPRLERAEDAPPPDAVALSAGTSERRAGELRMKVGGPSRMDASSAVVFALHDGAGEFDADELCARIAARASLVTATAEDAERVSQAVRSGARRLPSPPVSTRHR